MNQLEHGRYGSGSLVDRPMAGVHRNLLSPLLSPRVDGLDGQIDEEVQAGRELLRGYLGSLPS